MENQWKTRQNSMRGKYKGMKTNAMKKMKMNGWKIKGNGRQWKAMQGD